MIGKPACILLLLSGCVKSPAPPDVAALASTARTQLAERERKLTSYRFHGMATDVARNETLAFDVAYKSPNKLRGATQGATPHVLAFDGKDFRDLDVRAKKLTTYSLAGLPKGRADAFLHQVFAAFVPEGFRSPLLPAGPGLTAQPRQGERGPELLLDARIADGPAHYAFTFRFSNPAMDLLEKTISGPDGESRVQVLKQTCEPALRLCFPQELLESHGGKATVRTVLSEIAINAPVADAEFSLAVPEGGTEEHRALAAQP